MRVRLSVAARKDVDRLSAFLEEWNPSAADRVMDAIEAALLNLSEMADRGFRGPREGTRQLLVPFGRAAYVMQYAVGAREVVDLRIFHALEDR